MRFAQKLLPGDIEQNPSRLSVEFPVAAWQRTYLRDPSTLPRFPLRGREVSLRMTKIKFLDLPVESD